MFCTRSAKICFLFHGSYPTDETNMPLSNLVFLSRVGCGGGGLTEEGEWELLILFKDGLSTFL